MANNSTEALNELKTFQGSRRKSDDILRDTETRLGVPTSTQRQAGLRAAITNTENLIRSVEPSVAGRTSGSLVTDAQKTRLVGLERAPLDDSFREQSRAYDSESANLNELKRQASTESQLAFAEDDAKESGLKGLYDTLYQREQDEIARAERDRAFAEAQRQARAAAAGSSNLAKLLAGGNKAAAGGASPLAPKQRADKGFEFVNEYGNPISAFQYAAMTGTPVRDLLQVMARSGDTGAKTALNFVGNDGGYDPTKVNSKQLADLYNALAWGTGLSASVYSPSSSSKKASPLPAAKPVAPGKMAPTVWGGTYL